MNALIARFGPPGLTVQTNVPWNVWKESGRKLSSIESCQESREITNVSLAIPSFMESLCIRPQISGSIPVYSGDGPGKRIPCVSQWNGDELPGRRNWNVRTGRA